MAENKTKPTSADVMTYLAGIAEPQRVDSLTLIDLMRAASGQEPTMWGPSMIGFGHYRYHYASGREGETFIVGFAPRKPNMTLYVGIGSETDPQLLERLGKHTTGKGCLYIKRLSDVDLATLQQLIERCVARHQSV